MLWADGTLPLRVTSYLVDAQPPLSYVTSVRALVFKGDAIVVIRDPTGHHVIPGGRREEGETLAETLQREVLEETGWTLSDWSLLGVMHFRHLAPKPEGYPYPYPDFLQLIYRAEAGRFVPGAQAPSEWELGCELRPIREARLLDLTPSQLLFLEAALALRAVR